MPVKFVDPVGVPPEPPAVLVPKPFIWAFAGCAMAHAAAISRADERVTGRMRLRYMAVSVSASGPTENYPDANIALWLVNGTIRW